MSKMSLCVNTLSSHWPTEFLSRTVQHNFFNVSSILQMHDSKFLLYLERTGCQHLLSNKKSEFKGHPCQNWLLIKYYHVRDFLELQFPITIMYVHFHALWIHCTVKTYLLKKLCKLLCIRPKRIKQTSYS